MPENNDQKSSFFDPVYRFITCYARKRRGNGEVERLQDKLLHTNATPGITSFMKLLKLNALDNDDLGVLSAHLQDAVIKIGDMRYLAEDRQFVMVLNRFDWGDALTPERRKKTYTRVRSGLQFGHVLSVKKSKVMQANIDAVVDLLAIEFTPTQTPSGVITLIFAGGGAIRLEVECIEARLNDLGLAWQTGNLPDHEEQ